MVLKKGVTAHDVWVSLENIFRDNKDAHAMHLEQDLCSIEVSDMSVIEYR